ncbi:MAG TPA: hypothetical protein VFW03_09130 [Gemmatimonadaceae bacterium]|nr:hypothetical protein [Gemmatimonadaceae bacterium]
MPTRKQKVWVVTTGWYSDYSVVAVLNNKAEAERVAKELDGNEPEEFELLGSVSHQILHVHTADLVKPYHPTVGSPGMPDHFHAGSPDDCFDCNPGHDMTGPCRKCKRGIKVDITTREEKIWPWDPEYPVKPRPHALSTVSDNNARAHVEVEGGDRSLVEKSLQDRIAQAKAQMEGLT